MLRHRSRPTRARRPAVLVCSLLVVTVVGCSDSDGDSGGADVTTAAGDASTTSTPRTAPAADIDQTPPVGANGIKYADDGTLWIASIGSDAILQVDPDTGRILRRIGVPAGSGPDDVALAADGTVYWSGYASGAVGMIEPDRDETVVLASVGAGANPIALRGDGMLVVGRAGGTTGLYTVDPSGDAPATPLSDPGNLNSFDITPDGRLFAPDLVAGVILEIDADTGETVRTVTKVDGAPVGARWHDDQLFVLVISAGARVVRVDPATGATELFGETGLAVADNLAVGDDGRVYVTGLGAPTVTVLDPDGAVERTISIGG